jgi:putative alpha-1,2-mannosidase
MARLANARRREDDLLGLVNIFWGTGGHGHTYPGATVPFGMVQLSPDTYNDDWDWCSGYHSSDDTIMGFSHTHLSGTGCGDLLDFLVVPRTGEVRLSRAIASSLGPAIARAFRTAMRRRIPATIRCC